MLTPAQILLLIRVVLVALVLAALLGLGWYYRSAVARAEPAEAALSEATATAQATTATTGALGEAQTDTQRVEVVVTQGRAAAAQAVQELSNADPSVRELRALPIPDQLRDIARQRREARDRPAGAPAGG
jgi:endonuclease/exonuclease/phosphatase (EEP) superfamily protein YafD